MDGDASRQLLIVLDLIELQGIVLSCARYNAWNAINVLIHPCSTRSSVGSMNMSWN